MTSDHGHEMLSVCAPLGDVLFNGGVADFVELGFVRAAGEK